MSEKPPPYAQGVGQEAGNMYPPNQGSTAPYPAQPYTQPYPPIQNSTTSTVVVTGAPSIVLTGNCPSCRAGNLIEEYSCCGIVLAVLFFPIGILCCLAMTDKRCSNCGRTF